MKVNYIQAYNSSKGTASNSLTTAAKPTFNYGKFMRSLWIDARQGGRMLTPTGATESGDRVVWFAVNGTKTCQGNVLTNGEVVFPNVFLGNNNGYTIGVFENCP